MKKIITSIIFLAFATALPGQQVVQTQFSIQADFLKKSKNQRKAGWILLGSGAGLVATGVAIPSKVTDYGNPLIAYDDKYSNDWGVLILPGILAMLGSIPLFIASSRNKRKAEMVSAFLKIETGSFVRQSAITQFRYPAFEIKLKF